VSGPRRGTLMHHYKVDDNGIVAVGETWSFATGHNNMAMNRAVLQVARKSTSRRTGLEESMLKPGRAVHPLLRTRACPAPRHALGQMALRVQLLAPDGKVLSEIAR